MILHDATKIMINSIGADKVLHRGDLIWPTEEPVSLTGVRFIDGSVHELIDSSILTLMEHGCSSPFWIEHTGDAGEIYAELAGSSTNKFTIKKYSNGLFVVADNAEKNIDSDVGYTCTINVWCDADNTRKSFTVKTQPEFADRDFLYTDKSCSFICQDIPADGISEEREFFLADQWRGPFGSQAILPIRNNGPVGIGRRVYGRTLQEAQSYFGSYGVSTSYGSADYNPGRALSIINVRSDFGNCIVKYNVTANTSGSERCFLVKVTPARGEIISFNTETYIFMIQQSK